MSTENISLRQQVRESVNTTSIVSIDATGCAISDITSQLWAMDGVTEVNSSQENDGTWDVTGVKDGDEFRLRVTCNL